VQLDGASTTGLTISFTNDSLSASAGCNTMATAASLRDGVLHLDDGLSMTEMGCDPGRMDKDQRLAELLSGEPRVEVDEMSLTLSSSSTRITLTDSEIADPDRSLVETLWGLDATASGDVMSSVPQGISGTIIFGQEGRYRARLGCNQGSGQYTVDGQMITFGPMKQTRKRCPDEAMVVERAVAQVLQGSATYSIDGRALILTNGSRALGYRSV
jgi:heat shock protein HslJ